MRPRPVRTVAIAGCKGGVGTSVIAANLAVALGRTVPDVLLFDADLACGGVAALLGMPDCPHWPALVAGERPLSTLIQTGPAGIGVIAASSGCLELSRLSRIDHAAIIARFSEAGVRADTLLVDTPSGLSDAAAMLAAATRDVVMVIVDEPAALRDAAAFMSTLTRRYRARRFRTLVNRAGSERHARDVHTRLMARIDPELDVLVEPAGAIPEDSRIGQAVRGGCPVVEMFPRSPSALAFARLATRVARWPRPDTPAGGIEYFVERLVQAADSTLVRATA